MTLIKKIYQHYKNNKKYSAKLIGKHFNIPCVAYIDINTKITYCMPFNEFYDNKNIIVSDKIFNFKKIIFVEKFKYIEEDNEFTKKLLLNNVKLESTGEPLIIIKNKINDNYYFIPKKLEKLSFGNEYIKITKI